jgi:hypothetical protein
MVAEFRATHDLWAGNPAFIDLLTRLEASSTEFRKWWATHDIAYAAAGRKKLHHPKKGAMKFDNVSFQSNDDPGLKLVIYTAV